MAEANCHAPTIIHVFWHDDCLKHSNGSGFFDMPPDEFLEVTEPHPEGTDRLRNMRSILKVSFTIFPMDFSGHQESKSLGSGQQLLSHVLSCTDC
jgi:hypothetical protein